MAASWWRSKYNLPTSHPAFAAAVPEELVGEMIESMHNRRDALLRQQEHARSGIEVEIIRVELVDLEKALGLPTSMDPLTEYWRQRSESGELTEEDLHLSLDDVLKMQAEGTYNG